MISDDVDRRCSAALLDPATPVPRKKRHPLTRANHHPNRMKLLQFILSQKTEKIETEKFVFVRRSGNADAVIGVVGFELSDIALKRRYILVVNTHQSANFQRVS